MRDINKRFQRVQALSAASLEVEPGEIMALVGQNGIGKSTMIKVLTGAYRQDWGSILFQPADRFRLPAGGSARRRQHHLPRDQPRSVPLSGRERLSWPRTSALRLARLESHGYRRLRTYCSASRSRSTCAGVDGILNRTNSADGRDRARGFVQGAARHHGRARPPRSTSARSRFCST